MDAYDFMQAYSNAGGKITLVDDKSGEEIVSLVANGYQSLDEDVANRKVESWKITRAMEITARLGREPSASKYVKTKDYITSSELDAMWGEDEDPE